MWRQGKAKRVGGPEVDDQLKIGWLLSMLKAKTGSITRVTPAAILPTSKLGRARADPQGG
jgi:hypothetical protein